MVNQALRMKIAYWSKEEKEKENARDRSVPDGSDNKAGDIQKRWGGANLMKNGQ